MSNKILYTYIILVVAIIILSFFVWVFPHKQKKNSYNLTEYLNISAINLNSGGKGFLSYNENSEVIALSIIFKGGSFLEPLNKKGITSILTSIITSSYNDEIKNTLKKYSIKFDTTFGIDNITFNILVTKKNLDHMLRVLKLILEHNNFDNSDFQVTKSKALLNIKLSNHYTNIRGMQELYKAIFSGDKRFLNSFGTETSINSISLKDVIDVKKLLLTKNNIVVGVSGNVNSKDLTRKLNKVFASLPTGSSINSKKDFLSIRNGTINIPVANSTNTDIFIALPMPKVNDKNFFAASVLNTYLGSGLNSLLVEEVRIKRGLAYTIHSSIVNTLYGNFLIINATTEHSKVKSTIDVIKTVLYSLYKKEYSKLEINKVKQYMTNSYIILFSDSESIAINLAKAAFYGKTEDSIYYRNDSIQKVTKESIDNVINKYFNVNNLLIVTSGVQL